MKKISILGLSMLALLSCTKSYKVTEVSLLSTDDSVNYALGFLNGYQIKEMALPNDSSDESIAEFIDALQRGYDGKVEELSETQKAGRDFVGALKMFEEKGLVGQAAWTLNEKILLQGLVNGLLRDTTMMMPDEARNYFQEKYQAMMQNAPASDTNPAKAIKAKCGKKAAVIKLADQIDSLNYAFGLLNGSEIAQYVLAQDSTGEEFKVFVKAVNKGLKSNTKNPQLVEQGEQIGKTIKEQEAMGLLNIPQLATNFEMLKQGFINGMYKDEKQMTMDQANQYLSATISNIQFGENKKKCEQFLAENKLKEGVTVTASGLQYEVLKTGKGPKPTATDKVKVHYHGTLIDGTVFDSSVERGEPITFPLNQVIAGWTEGLQLMPVGSKFRFYIPQELGYGAQGMGASIPGYSTLIFEVELLGIEK